MQASKPISGVEAGVAVTNDPNLYDRMAALGHYGRVNQLLQTDALRDLGRIGLGVKYRANPLGIALARAGLERLPDLNERRRRWFARLDALLDDVTGVYPQRPYARRPSAAGFCCTPPASTPKRSARQSRPSCRRWPRRAWASIPTSRRRFTAPCTCSRSSATFHSRDWVGPGVTCPTTFGRPAARDHCR